MIQVSMNDMLGGSIENHGMMVVETTSPLREYSVRQGYEVCITKPTTGTIDHLDRLTEARSLYLLIWSRAKC